MKKILIVILIIVMISSACTKKTEEVIEEETVAAGIITASPTPTASPSPNPTATPTLSPTAAPKMGTVTLEDKTSYLNLRAEANTSSEILGELYSGATVEILEEIGSWYRVKSGDITGYVYADFVVIAE